MTTSEPQAGRRDDGDDHRTFGQRIRDAVLGDPEETRDGPDVREVPPAHAGYGERAASGAGPTGPGTTGDGGWGAAAAESGQGAGSSAGYAEPPRAEVGRDRGPAPDTDRGYASSEWATREHGPGGVVPDPVRDDVRQDTAPRDVGAAPGDRDLVTSSYDPDRDTGYDPQAAGTAMTGAPGAGAAAGDRDFVTRSYDPDRDTGYDPQAAGTAMSGPTGDTRGYDTRDYEPTRDTGYVDEDRVDTDRATGHRDADYDTGRVDADHDTGRVDAGGHRGAAAAAAGAAAAGGSAAVAGLVAPHERRDDDRAGARFSEVDDTATVEPTGTGRATPDTQPVAHPSGDVGSDRRAEAVADETTGSGGRERLLSSDRAREYTTRWDALKGDFVDEPRRAVAQADGLVGELLDEIQRVFADQRRDLEQGFDHDQASTEDLRLALRRYRSFFDRLLSF
jgi:hypothetical protein